MMQLESISQDDFLETIARHEQYKGVVIKDPEIYKTHHLGLAFSHLQGGSFENRYLSEADFVGCWFQDTIFVNCDWSGVKSHECLFENCQFLNCKFTKAEIYNSCFVRANFTGSSFEGLWAVHSVFLYADFTNTVLRNAWFGDVDLRFATLQNVNIERIRLSDTKFFCYEKFVAKRPEKIGGIEISIDAGGHGEKHSGMEALEHIFNFVE